MKKLKTLLYSAALLLMSKAAAAQTYSLQDCVHAALENNQQLQNSRLDIDAAGYRVKEVRSALLPTIDVNGQLMYYRDVPSQYAPASAFGGPEGEYAKLTLAMPQTTSATLSVTQNLYNQSLLIGLKAAKVSREASALSEKVTRENIVYNVTSTYYSIQVLNDNITRLAENITNLENTAQATEALKKNEIVSDNVHNRILINLENLRNQFENQKLLLDRNISTLKYLMNVGMNEPVIIQSFDYSQALENSGHGDILQRPDVMLQAEQVKIAEYDKKVIAAGYFPTLTNNFNFGYSGYYDELSPFKQINNDWIQSSYFALSLKIPVFDGFKKQNQLRQKEVAIQKNQNTLSLMKANADKEVQDAIRNYITNEGLWLSNKKSLNLAEHLFSSAQSEYENGITSLTDFLNAQNDLSTARTNYSTALLNLKLAEITLKKANGTLLN